MATRHGDEGDRDATAGGERRRERHTQSVALGFVAAIVRARRRRLRTMVRARAVSGPTARATTTAGPTTRPSVAIARRARPRSAVIAAAMLASTVTLAFAPSTAAAPGPTPASAALGQSRVLSYPVDAVWPATIRYLRVDRGYAIVDRDADAGFILFEIPAKATRADAPAVRGSFEVFATKDASGRPSAHVEVATEGGPAHLPHAILDGLAAKLRAEQGPPAPPPGKPPQGGKKPETKPSEPPPPPGDGEPPDGLDPDDADLVIDPSLDP